MQFLSVNEGNSVRDDMTVQMILVLMYSDQGLMRREKSVGECLPNFKALGRCNPLFGVKSDDVVGIHPAGILIPEPLLIQKTLVYTRSCDSLLRIRTGDPDISFPDFVIPEHVADEISHSSVGLCPAVDDLIDSHTSSLSFLYIDTRSEIFDSSRVAGRVPDLFAMRAI